MKISLKSVTSYNLLIAISFGLLAIGFYSCSGGGKGTAGSSDTLRQSCINAIHASETQLKTLHTPDAAVYNNAITAYTRFADNFPNDTVSPAYLFNAAGIALSLNQYQRAINLFDTINTKYPSFKKAADCIFIRGFIYDDKLKDTAKARAMYQQVIDKYPNDSLASQARAAIAILGKSYDEVIKEFEEKNKNKK